MHSTEKARDTTLHDEK